jgi:hypothetical protein
MRLLLPLHRKKRAQVKAKNAALKKLLKQQQNQQKA